MATCIVCKGTGLLLNDVCPLCDGQATFLLEDGSSRISTDVVQSEPQLPTMEELESLCKQRGFIFRSSEIYGGFAGFFDYGPLGVELKRNITQHWWRTFVQCRDDMVGLDSSIIHSPQVWETSGHVAGFADPMTECRSSQKRFRADHLLFARVDIVTSTNEEQTLGYLCIEEPDGDANTVFQLQAEKLMKANDVCGTLKPFQIKEVADATPEELALLPSPASGCVGDLTVPRAFNMMFTTKVGAATDSSATAYLRPETAQGIFVNFKNVCTTTRSKLPFGIAQIGKAFRNEITPRNFVFRSREFEQMEIEYFVPPSDDVWTRYHNQWVQDAKAWVLSLGIREDLVELEKHEEDKLAHYAKACTDVTFRFPFGQQELLGVCARGNFDLTKHKEASGKSLEYFDEATREKFLPHVIEPSIGVDRLFLAILTSAYAVDEVDGEKRVVLRLHPCIAPIKVAVLPLVKNKELLTEKAHMIFTKLQKRYQVAWDVAGSIGKRYRRMDEVGTPFCVTVDHTSLEDDTVTVRERDSAKQTRVRSTDLYSYLASEIDGF